MKLSRNGVAPRSPSSHAPSFGGSVAAVGVGVAATAVAGACSTALLLVIDSVRAGGPPQPLLESLGYLSVLIGSGYAAVRSRRRGWAHGALSAVFSFAIVILSARGAAGYAAIGTGSGMQALALVALTGAAGGILGLSLRKS